MDSNTKNILQESDVVGVITIIFIILWTVLIIASYLNINNEFIDIASAVVVLAFSLFWMYMLWQSSTGSSFVTWSIISLSILIVIIVGIGLYDRMKRF